MVAGEAPRPTTRRGDQSIIPAVTSVQIGTPKISPAQPIGPISSTIATSTIRIAHHFGRTFVRKATTAIRNA